MSIYSAASISQIRHNLEVVQNNITKAANDSSRSPANIKLVVVTKTHPLEIVRAAIEAGVNDLGENYAQEAKEKIEAIGKSAQLSWHMIGHVQSRKAGLVVKYFDYLHSLDNFDLAQRLNHQAREENRILPVLLEVNVSGEASKGGWHLGKEAEWDNLLPIIEPITFLPQLRVCGLMTIPPYTLNPDEVRPCFVKLRNFSEYLKRHLPQSNWDELSMGMSTDYQVAIEEGATIVRIGQAILGPRHS